MSKTLPTWERYVTNNWNYNNVKICYVLNNPNFGQVATAYYWGMEMPGPAHDLQRSQTVASTSSLLCGCERRSLRTVTVEHPTESFMLYNPQLLCKWWFWEV